MKKCSVLEFGKSSRRVPGNYSLNDERIMKKTEERDLRSFSIDLINIRVGESRK